MNQHFRGASSFLLDEIRKTVARGLIWAGIAAILFVLTPLWDRVQAVWRSVEEIAAIRDDLHELRDALAVLSADVARATGEDRVIRQPPGLSYVEEPVYRGDLVVLYLVVQRTRLGTGCRFVSGTPLFTDSTGVTSAGVTIPPARQLGPEMTKLRLELQPPKHLAAGRIELYLALDYDCNGVRVPDRTDPVVFTLLERGTEQ